nr:MAG TPA: hypothetical protein [Microviridae sp.]
MKEKVVLGLKILAAIIAAVLTVLGASSCTMSLSIQKSNNNSTQGTEQTTSVDSTKIELPIIKK